MKGYKVFNSDWSCKGKKYDVGKTYKHDGELMMCESGFHFCLKLMDCFSYYPFNPDNKVAEVEAVGKVLTHDDDSKVCTDELLIIREMSWIEVLALVNTGKGNIGNRNSGDMNSGDRNSGYMNSGDMNSGNRNSGGRNSGYMNSGYRNSGNMNSGYRNSGNRNSGDRNSGDFNSCNFSAGVFCTETPKVKIFDIDTTMTLDDWKNTEWANILFNFNLTLWINSEDMTAKEKKDNPKYETTGGYLKVMDYKTAWKVFWKSLSAENKAKLKTIPNFDRGKFEHITGIKI